MQRLNAHFDDEHEQFLKRVDDQIAHLRKTSAETEEVLLPHDADFYEDLTKEYKHAKSELIGALTTTRNFLDVLLKELTQKKGRPFDSYTLVTDLPKVQPSIVENVNQMVRKHNAKSDNFEVEVKQARKSLANHLVAEALDIFNQLVISTNKFRSAVDKASSDVKCLKKKIDQLERDIVEHRRPAEELNKDMHNYLGHSELQLTVKDTGYAITRNDMSADALSEGETTAIALLYFLKSLQDRDFNLSQGVVVLDDPVSSLDANALYLAFGFIQERTKNAAQLFILTHNFIFFRNIRNWFHHLKGQRKDDVKLRSARFYMLDWQFNGGRRCSVLRPLDPLLERYESEYHYLFARVYREVYDPLRENT